MNKKSLVKIINKELTILTDIVGEFSKEGDVQPFEVAMALSKTKEIYGQLLLLKEDKTSLTRPIQNKPSLEDNNSSMDLPELSLNNTVTNPLNEQQLIPNEPPFHTRPSAKPEESVQNVEPARETPVLEPMQQIKADEETPQLKEHKTGLVLKPRESEEAPPVEATVLVMENKTDVPNSLNESKVESPALKPEKEEAEIPQDSSMESNQVKVKSKSALANNKSGIIADRFQNLSPSLNDMLSGIKKNKDLASSIKDRPIRNLKSAIKLNDKIWYTNELFNKNKTLFEKTIDNLNQAADLDEALAYLFSNFNWDQNQKSTISFLELVFRRYTN